MKIRPFELDIREIRRRAREDVEQGAVTSSYGADRETVLRMLGEALATELTCVLRYRRHYYMASGIHSQSAADEFWDHSVEEMEHVDKLAERIIQLGGAPDFDPAHLTARSHSEYVAGESLIDMLQEDLVAERVAIDSYRAMIRHIGDGDPTSRRVLEDILGVEEEHAEDLTTLLGHFEIARAS